MTRADRTPRVAYKGVPGAFGEEAVVQHWGGRATEVPTESFDAALTAVIAGLVDGAVIPTWNSSIGDIESARDALNAVGDDVEIVANVEIPVRHSLWSANPRGLRDVRVAGSHTAALAQCRAFFAEHPLITPGVEFDTASAARDLRDPRATWMIASGADSAACAAIAGRAAGARYGLSLLAEDIHDDPDNRTRFAVVRWQRWWHG
jgi:prephenate dehydratase